MKQRTVLESKRASLYYDLMQQVKQYDVNPIMKHDVKDELYAMLKENELRNESIESLFPEGTSIFIQGLVAELKKKTLKEHVLELCMLLFGVYAACGLLSIIIRFSETGTMLQTINLDFGFMIKIVLYMMIALMGRKIREHCLINQRGVLIQWGGYGVVVFVAVPLLYFSNTLSAHPAFHVELPCLFTTIISMASTLCLALVLQKLYHQDMRAYLRKDGERI